MHGVCSYAPTTSSAAVVLRCARNISAPPPAARAGPPGAGRRGLGAAAAVWGAGRVIVFVQYVLISLCFNKKCVSSA
jgi:hypothetical protein